MPAGSSSRTPGLSAIRVGDRVEMRKPHACGANLWTVVRTGADIRVRCDQCQRAVMLSRAQLAKAVRKVLRPEPPDAP